MQKFWRTWHFPPAMLRRLELASSSASICCRAVRGEIRPGSGSASRLASSPSVLVLGSSTLRLASSPSVLVLGSSTLRLGLSALLSPLALRPPPRPPPPRPALCRRWCHPRETFDATSLGRICPRGGGVVLKVPFLDASRISQYLDTRTLLHFFLVTIPPYLASTHASVEDCPQAGYAPGTRIKHQDLMNIPRKGTSAAALTVVTSWFH